MGPFSEGALKDAVAKGRVHPEDLAVSQESARSGTYTYLAVRKVLNMPEEKPAAASPNSPRLSRDPVVVPPQVQVLAVAAQENTPPPVNTTKPEFLSASSSEDTAVTAMPAPVREPRRASSVTQETQSTERAPEWSSASTGGPSRLKWAGLGLSAVAAMALWLGTRGSSTDMVGGVKKLPAQSSPSAMVSRPRAAASESSQPRKAPARSKTSRSLRLPEAQPRQLDMSDVPGEGIHTPAAPETNNVPEPMPPPPGLEEPPPVAMDAPVPPPPPASAADGAMETQGLPQPLEQ